jgi:hypothetical protein
LNSGRQRRGNVQRVAKVETENQNCQAQHCHADAISRDCIDGEKHASNKQGGPQILLNEEENERRRNPAKYRQQVIKAWKMEPTRDAKISNQVAVNLSQQFPSTRKVAGEK